MEIFCQKHPTENLYMAQMSYGQLKYLLPKTNFSKLNGNNITVNVREIGGSDTTFSPVELRLRNNLEVNTHGVLSIDPDNVECSVVKSTEIGNQADGSDLYNVTFQCFKKKRSVRLTEELINQILTFPVSDDFDGEEEHYEGAYELVARLQEELKK